MAKTLSEDLRVRVIAAVNGGMSRNAAAERFGIAAATAVRWLRAWNDTGATAARPKGGDLRSQRIEAFRDVILGAIKSSPDMTIVELAEMLRREHGASFAPSTIWRFLDRHGVTLKKHRARKRAATARHRGTTGRVPLRADPARKVAEDDLGRRPALAEHDGNDGRRRGGELKAMLTRID
jgi:transposase